MATAQGIRAGKAYIELGTRDTALHRGLRQAENRLRAFGASVKNVGASMVRMGAMVATPFVASSKVFAGYESQMARVRALTKASDEDFARLSVKAKELGASTIFSAAQAAEAMGVFALAGFDVDAMLKSVGPTLQLAAAGQVEIAEAADIAAKIMAGMGVEADDLAGTMDMLTKAMTTANTDISQLGAAFKFVGPIAKTANQSIEGVTAAIQMLSNAGIQGEMAGTSIRGSLLALTSPSEKAKKVLDDLGVSVTDASGNVRPLVDIIAQLQQGMARMGSGQKLDALGSIFGARPASGMAVLIDQGASRLKEMTEALEDAGGVAGDIAAVQLDTLGGSIKIVISALQGLAIEIGESISPSVREWSGRMIEATNFISKLVRENRDLVIAAAKVGAGLVAGGAALIAFGTAAKLAAVGIGVLKVAIAALSSPIGLATAAMVVGGYAFLNYTETGQAALGSLKTTTQSVMGAVKDALMGGDVVAAGKVMWLGLQLEWMKGLKAINDRTGGFVDTTRKAFSDLRFSLAKAFLDIVAVGKLAFAELSGIVRKLWAQIKAFASGTDAAADIARINAETAARKAQVRADAASQMDALADQREAADVARLGIDDELDRLQRELAEAIEATKPKAAVEAIEEALEAGTVRELPTPSELDEAIGESERRSTDVAGSFSAAALRGLSAGDTAGDRTAEATEETAAQLRRLNEHARRGRLVFGA